MAIGVIPSQEAQAFFEIQLPKSISIFPTDSNKDIQTKLNPDWEKELNRYKSVIASGSEAMQVKATIKLAHLSKHVPEHILAQTVPIVAQFLADTTNESVQKAAAYCLKCIACQGEGALATEVAQSGAVNSILRLLPQSSGSFRMVLIKCLWWVVNFGYGSPVIVARNGGLEIIIDLLNSCGGNDRLKLLEILSALALLREARKTLTRLGAHRFLVEAASCGGMVSRERACQAIGLLGVARRVKRMLVEMGVIPVLVNLFRDGDTTTKLVAGNSLGVISAHVDFIRPVAEAGAIPLYAGLLEGSDLNGKEIAKDAFCVLAVAEVNAVAIAEQLMRILKEGDDEAKVAASDVIWDLSGYKLSISVFRNLGAIPILVELLRDGNGEVREKVSGAIAQLSYDETDRVVLADAGAIPILIELLVDDSEDLRDNAAEAVVNFSEDPYHRDVISAAVDGPLLQSMQNRLSQLRASDEHMVGSLRRMSIEHLTWDPALY